MTASTRLDRAIDSVVRRQNCSGCGACTLLDPGLTMELDDAGFRRPVRHNTTTTPSDNAHGSSSRSVPDVGSTHPGRPAQPSIRPLDQW